MAETFEIGLLIFACAAFALLAFTLYDRRDRNYAGPDYDRALHAFFRRATERGLSTKEALLELAMRRHYVSVRNAVSDAVLADPRSYDAALKKAVSEEARMLANIDGPRAAAKFRQWMAELKTADILYQDAYDAFQATIAPLRYQPTELDRAALRIVPRSR